MNKTLTIKQSLVWLMFVFVILYGGPELSYGDDSEARKIMEKVDARDDGDNFSADISMVLIDKNGKKRVRRISSFSKDKKEDTYRLMLFLSPADVKDTAFLTYDYDTADRNDDQWLYLPALRKTKRIASSDKSGSFMGSDFNYADMTSRELENYDYFLKKEMDDRGHKAWLIESIPRSKKVIDETGYSKSLLIIRQDNYVMTRAIHWENHGGYQKYLDVKKLELIDNIWVGTKIHVTKKRNKKTMHKTILTLNNVKFNQPLILTCFHKDVWKKVYNQCHYRLKRNLKHEDPPHPPNKRYS